MHIVSTRAYTPTEQKIGLMTFRSSTNGYKTGLNTCCFSFHIAIKLTDVGFIESRVFQDQPNPNRKNGLLFFRGGLGSGVIFWNSVERFSLTMAFDV